MSKRVKVKVCVKGKKCPCKGSKEILETFEELVRKKGLQDEVAVKGCSCLKSCKHGPVVYVKSADSKEYTHVQPDDCESILDSQLKKKKQEKKKKK